MSYWRLIDAVEAKLDSLVLDHETRIVETDVEVETIRLMVKVMSQRLTKLEQEAIDLAQGIASNFLVVSKLDVRVEELEEAVKTLQQGLSEPATPWNVPHDD